jgi:hypothetical protein
MHAEPEHGISFTASVKRHANTILPCEAGKITMLVRNAANLLSKMNRKNRKIKQDISDHDDLTSYQV